MSFAGQQDSHPENVRFVSSALTLALTEAKIPVDLEERPSIPILSSLPVSMTKEVLDRIFSDQYPRILVDAVNEAKIFSYQDEVFLELMRKLDGEYQARYRSRIDHANFTDFDRGVLEAEDRNQTFQTLAGLASLAFSAVTLRYKNVSLMSQSSGAAALLLGNVGIAAKYNAESKSIEPPPPPTVALGMATPGKDDAVNVIKRLQKRDEFMAGLVGNLAVIPTGWVAKWLSQSLSLRKAVEKFRPNRASFFSLQFSRMRMPGYAWLTQSRWTPYLKNGVRSLGRFVKYLAIASILYEGTSEAYAWGSSQYRASEITQHLEASTRDFLRARANSKVGLDAQFEKYFQFVSALEMAHALRAEDWMTEFSRIMKVYDADSEINYTGSLAKKLMLFDFENRFQSDKYVDFFKVKRRSSKDVLVRIKAIQELDHYINPDKLDLSLKTELATREFKFFKSEHFDLPAFKVVPKSFFLPRMNKFYPRHRIQWKDPKNPGTEVEKVALMRSWISLYEKHFGETAQEIEKLLIQNEKSKVSSAPIFSGQTQAEVTIPEYYILARYWAQTLAANMHQKKTRGESKTVSGNKYVLFNVSAAVDEELLKFADLKSIEEKFDDQPSKGSK